MNRRTMTVPRHLVQSDSIPEEATIELVIEYGRVRKLVAMTDECVWFADVDFDAEAGFTLSNVRGMIAGQYKQLAVLTYG